MILKIGKIVQLLKIMIKFFSFKNATSKNIALLCQILAQYIRPQKTHSGRLLMGISYTPQVL